MAKASKSTAAWKEEADQRTKELTDKLEKGITELFSSDKYKDFLKAMSHFHNYSARNVMLIHTQMPGATRVASFKTWKEQFNRSPKKGETSLRIYAPIGSKKPETKLFEKIDPATNKPMLDKDGNTIMEELTAVSSLNMRFKLVPVFDVSQTVGEPLPQLAEDLTGNVEHYEAFLDTLKAVSPLPIVFEPMNPEQDGYCRFGEKIGIREGMSEIQTVSAIIHEITHARLHDRELLAAGEKPKSKEVKEIEAESVSYVVCQKYGIETGDNSFGYLASWSDHDMKEFRASIDTIRKEANTIINAIDDRFAAICKERGIDLTAAEQPPQQAAVKTPENPITPEYTTESTTQNIAGVDFSFEEVKPVVPEKEQPTAATPEKSSKITVEQQNFEKLSELFPQIADGEFYHQRMEAGAGFMPLSLEWIGENQLSIMHTYVQNGDLMYDPMIVFDVDREAKTATAVEFQQSNPPLYQRIEDGIGHSIDGNGNERTISDLQGQINDFATQWFTNIGNQEYVPITAVLQNAEYADATVFFNSEQKPFSLAFVYSIEGTTVLNNLDKDDNGKLVKVAYVDSFRNVEFFEENLPKDVVMIVENVKLANERTEQEKQAAASEKNVSTETESPTTTQTVEQSPPQEPAEPMPDPTISIADMTAYGYTAEDMLPLQYDRAIDLFKQDHSVFLLFNDGTESMVFDSSEIVDHDGIYGMEREEWQNSNEFKELSAQQEQTPAVEHNGTEDKEPPPSAPSEQSSPPDEPPLPEEPPTAEPPDIPKNEQSIYKFSSQHAIKNGEIEAFHESRNLNIECGNAIDQAITDSNYEQYRYDLKTAARNVIEEFGADRVAWVVAATVNDQSWDGRLSNNNKDWAKDFDTPKPDIYLKTHLAVLDGFVKCFREVEKEKPSLMTAIKAGEQKSKAEFGGKAQPGMDTPEKSTKKNNDER